MRKQLSAIIALLAIATFTQVTLSGCSYRSTQTRAQERLSREAFRAVGMPAIKNFFEKRLLKSIDEKRDQPFPSYTYIVDRYGHLHKLCNSIGYGIPYATQYTNPDRVSRYDSSVILPQADPNGLFSPSSANGTWVDCVFPGHRTPLPIYAEPNVIVSPVALKADA